MIRLFFVLFLVPGLNGSVNTPHEYFISITEIRVNDEKHRVEVISRLFFDDFKEVLKERYSSNLKLEPGNVSEDVEMCIKKYFEKKLKITLDGQSKTLDYLGYKFEDDRINIFLKIENVYQIKEILVDNLLLTDLFEDQQNIVHAFKGEQKQSTVLTKYKSEHLLKFD